jgi:hypothetical protein
MQHIKKIYLYAVSLISLVMLVIATVMLLNLALKALIFKKADVANYYDTTVMCASPAIDAVNPSEAYPLPPECNDPQYKEKQAQAEEERRAGQKQQEAAQAIAMILVAAPVFYYHWRLARRES